MTSSSIRTAKAGRSTAREGLTRPWRLLLHLILLAGALLMAYPFAWMILSAFKPLREIFMSPPRLFPQEWQPKNFVVALDSGGFFLAAWNSLYIAVLVVVIALVTSAMAAYAFARIEFKGRAALFMVFLATLMVPSQLTVIPLYLIMARIGWVDTHLALIVPPALFNAFGVFLLRQFIRGIPRELDDAAEIDGASRIQVFFMIILPLLRTPLVALGIFTFLAQWNNFFYALIFLNSSRNFTLPLWVNQFKGEFSSDWTSLMAAASLAAVPLLIMFVIAQRQIVEGIALSGSKT